MIKYWKLFLLSFLLVVVVSCKDDNNEDTPPIIEEETDVTIEVLPGMNLVGKITDGTSPIGGIVVSDGYSVTTTNEKGIYQLKANTDSAKFVFVSVPAEYEIPLDSKGIPQMYKDITSLKNEGRKAVQRDFSLVKGVKKTQFTLVALADVQIAGATDLTLLEKETPKIKEYIASLGTPVYGISLGDLVWDNMAYLASYRNEIAKLGMPIFQVIGNHDHDMKVVGDDLNSAQQYERFFGPTYYSYNIGDCHFVILDDVDYQGGDTKDYTGNITASQLKWLKEDLSHVSKDKLIILGTHIPTKRRVSSTQVTNNADLYKLLEGYKVRIMSGHSHYNYTTTISADIEENSHGAVMGEFWTGSFCSDGSPKGFSVYEINGNQISDWYYKGTDHDKDYQMEVYMPGTAVTATYSNDVLINIFTWHTNWTVTVTEDSKSPVNLTTSIKEYDRNAYDFLGSETDDTKPVYRPTLAGSLKTDHILNYTPQAANWKKITVTATDPYGKVYTKTIENDKEEPVAIPVANFSLNETNWVYTQNFNSLLWKEESNMYKQISYAEGVYWIKGETLPGWYLSRFINDKTNAGTFRMDNGSYTAASFASYGYLTQGSIANANKTDADCLDRCLGSTTNTASGAINMMGVVIKNNTSQTIRSLTISYSGHLWKGPNNNQARQEKLEFSYTVNPTIILTGENINNTDIMDGVVLGTAYPALDFNCPYPNETGGVKGYGKMDGFAAQNMTEVSGTLTVVIPSGGTILLRWKDEALEGESHNYGKAIDNLKVKANF